MSSARQGRKDTRTPAVLGMVGFALRIGVLWGARVVSILWATVQIWMPVTGRVPRSPQRVERTAWARGWLRRTNSIKAEERKVEKAGDLTCFKRHIAFPNRSARSTR